jgi:hypothetical protein
MRQFRSVLLFFLVVPASAFLSWILFDAGWPVYPVAIGLMIAYAVSWQPLWDFRCPRCQECFFVSNYQSPYARRCLHCRLPLWTVEDEQPVHRLLVPTGREARD